jgi:hypothetical protein
MNKDILAPLTFSKDKPKSDKFNKMEKVVSGKPYVMYGDDNLLPNEIIARVQQSPKMNSILNNLSKIIEGNGFNISELDEPTIKFLRNNFDNDTWEDILEKISLDLMYFGGFALNVVWSVDGSRIARISHVPFQKVRVKRNEDVNSDITHEENYLICKDWSDKKAANNFIEIARFDVDDKENLSQLLYVTKYTQGMDYYPLPHWIGAYDYVKLDGEISDYQLNCAEEGYTPTLIINLATGIPSVEEQQAVAEKLDSKFKGSKGSKTIITFSDGKEQAPEVTTLDQSTSDSKYLNIEQMVLDNIIISNSIPNPNIIGIRVAGSLGGADEIIQSFLLLQQGFISNFQKIIKNKLNMLNAFANPGINVTDVDIIPYPIEKIIKKTNEQ